MSIYCEECVSVKLGKVGVGDQLKTRNRRIASGEPVVEEVEKKTMVEI